MKILFLLLVVPFVKCDRIVDTKSGPIRGISLTPRKVEAFLGIPYAEPPIGQLRFAKPVLKSPWDETYDANVLPPSCIQANTGNFRFAPHADSKMSEDCLYLNLWVPKGGSDLKAIVVFIHGGGLMVGSTNMKLYDGTTFSERGDVIVATINYRLGILGFFSGFIEEAQGNMGVYDQILAIQWIKDNAQYFRGDPDNIVLMGESAGAFLVSLHMVSPLSGNLFKRAILQSGTAFHPILFRGNERLSMSSQMIATMLGCSENKESLKKNPKEVIDCMKSLPAEKFSQTDLIFSKNGGWFSVRVGDDFLPEMPINYFRKGSFKDKDVLLGVTRDEGTLQIVIIKPEIFGTYGEKLDINAFNESSAMEFLNGLTTMGDENEISSIIRGYLDRVEADLKYTYLDATSGILGDFFVTCNAVFQADFQSLKENSVYFYLFDYRPPSTPLAEWMGVAHSEEMQYVFGNPDYENFTEFEEEFSSDIMDMWTAFVKTGNPNIPRGLKWPRYSFEDPKYYIISQKESVGVKPDNHRCEAWRNVFQAVIDDSVKQKFETTR